MTKLSTGEKVAIGAGVVVLAAAAITALQRSDEEKREAEGTPARGDGQAMWQAGDFIVVAAPTSTPEDEQRAIDVIRDLRFKAPDITFVFAPLKPHESGTGLDFSTISDEIAKLPVPAGSTNEGVLLLWTGGLLSAAQLIDFTDTSVSLVEVPRDGSTPSPEELAFIKKNRSPAHRLFVLRPEQPMEPVSNYVDSLLADLRNPAGLPNDRAL